MPKDKKSQRAKETSDKAIVARVTEEMAQPRIAESVQLETDELKKSKLRKTRAASHQVQIH